jgi:hypothetical protein
VKKPIKPIKILKKSTGSVPFRFYKPETKKTELILTEHKPEKNRAKLKKPSKTGKNRAKIKKSIQTDLNRFLS